MEDEMTCIFFDCEEYRLILEYQKEIESKSVKDAVMNAIILAFCVKRGTKYDN